MGQGAEVAFLSVCDSGEGLMTRMLGWQLRNAQALVPGDPELESAGMSCLVFGRVGWTFWSLPTLTPRVLSGFHSFIQDTLSTCLMPRPRSLGGSDQVSLHHHHQRLGLRTKGSPYPTVLFPALPGPSGYDHAASLSCFSSPLHGRPTSVTKPGAPGSLPGSFTAESKRARTEDRL